MMNAENCLNKMRQINNVDEKKQEANNQTLIRLSMARKVKQRVDKIALVYLLSVATDRKT